MIPETERCRWGWHMDRCNKSWRSVTHIWQYGWAALEKKKEQMNLTWTRIWKGLDGQKFKCTEVELLTASSGADGLGYTPYAQRLHKTPCKHHHCIPWEKLPRIHIWHGQLWIWTKLQEKGIWTGVYCKFGKHSLMKWPNAFENITTGFSSSFYPKITYGVPCFANLKFQTHLNLNSNSNWIQNRKEKQKGKRKRGKG